MASAPTFDQNVFAKRPIDPDAVGAYLTDARHKPLQNRAVEAYAPASTFKLVTSMALLDGGWISARRASPAPPPTASAGHLPQLGHLRQGHVRRPERHRGLVQHVLLARRGDDAQRDARLGAVHRAGGALARELGFGSPVGVGVREEKAGRIPDDAWVRAQPQYEHGWLPGFTMNTVIGQGDVLATPIQVTQLIQTLAMDGFQVGRTWSGWWARRRDARAGRSRGATGAPSRRACA
jgi:penicillin-binding protein 2